MPDGARTEEIMEDFSSVIRERRSIRKYLPDRVPDAVLREILDEARWAPSCGNTQSTEVYVLSGDTLERFKATLLERSRGETPPLPDLEIPTPWPEPYQSRRKATMEARAAFVAAEEKRSGAVSQDLSLSPSASGSELFGAPHVLAIATNKCTSRSYACFDAGLLTQTIALAAHARGLGTCITAAVIGFPEILRELIPGSENEIFIIGVTLGYPDHEAIINQVPRERASLEERVHFVEA